MSHYNKKCPIDIGNYGAIGPGAINPFILPNQAGWSSG